MTLVTQLSKTIFFFSENALHIQRFSKW